MEQRERLYVLGQDRREGRDSRQERLPDSRQVEGQVVSAACVHEWVLIEERLEKHPQFELRSNLRQRVRRFYCRWCREVVRDVEKEPVGV